ncbi:GAF sensor signal transduction histidine kinase [Desulfosarcina variabilis str. Montpellier]|uniref:ATP-binding protein n=1 Tax=Desulfosarcina variabilis TaxID=2300 RepID=UPI003AFA67EA
MTIEGNTSTLDSDPFTAAFLLPHPIVSPSQPIAISPLKTTIGRSPRNTIVISSTSVSRRHATIIFREGSYYVKDRDSRNGTFINDEKITVSRLHHHDLIAFGDQCFLFLEQSANKKGKQLDCIQNATSTITLSGDEIDPGSLYACAADRARLALYPKEEGRTLTDAVPSDQREGEASSSGSRGFQETAQAHPDHVADGTAPTSGLMQAHQRLSLLYQLSERMRGNRNTNKILNEGLDLILEAIADADRTAIMLRTGHEGQLKLAAYRKSNNQDQDAQLQISRTLLGWVLSEKIALMTQNVLDDARLKDSHSIRTTRYNAIICVPIIFKNKVIGVLYVDSANPVAQLTQDDVAFTAAIAHELALTIVNMQLQQTAIRNERMAAIGLTISNLAHNIKNLTMMNQNAVDLMKIHLDRIKDQKVEKCWQIIEKGLSRVNALSMEMLDYAREQDSSPTPMDINRAIEDNTAAIIPQTQANGIKLVFDLAPDLPSWTIDSKEFQRALINLIVNAIDAIGDQPDGEIRIRTALEKNMHLVVAVEDNGCGIDADKQPKIFDLFFTTKGTNGSGLGLPMVNKFLRASGGRLVFESQKDIGTTFKMVFPPSPELKHGTL